MSCGAFEANMRARRGESKGGLALASEWKGVPNRRMCFVGLGRLGAIAAAIGVLSALFITGCGGRSNERYTPVADGSAVITDSAADYTGAAARVVVRPSDYDQSCTNDEDCVAAAPPTACASDCSNACPSAAINVNAMARYALDVAAAKAMAAPRATQVSGCGCVSLGGPCCGAGKCQLGDACRTLGSPLPDDAGGDRPNIGTGTTTETSPGDDGAPKAWATVMRLNRMLAARDRFFTLSAQCLAPSIAA